jgi:hypothetical protein
MSGFHAWKQSQGSALPVKIVYGTRREKRSLQINENKMASHNHAGNNMDNGYNNSFNSIYLDNQPPIVYSR